MFTGTGHCRLKSVCRVYSDFIRFWLLLMKYGYIYSLSRNQTPNESVPLQDCLWHQQKSWNWNTACNWIQLGYTFCLWEGLVEETGGIRGDGKMVRQRGVKLGREERRVKQRERRVKQRERRVKQRERRGGDMRVRRGVDRKGWEGRDEREGMRGKGWEEEVRAEGEGKWDNIWGGEGEVGEGMKRGERWSSN